MTESIIKGSLLTTVGDVIFTKEGRIVTVALPAQHSYLGAYETWNICSIPSGFEPLYTTNGLIPTEERSVYMRLIVNKDNGKIQGYNAGSIIENCYRIATTFSYIGV